MRIVFLIRSLEIGGAETQLVALAAGLHAQGTHAVSVVTFYPGGALEQTLATRGVRVISAGKGGRWDLATFAERLRRILRGLRPDLLHTFLGGPNLFGAGLKPLLGGARLVWGVRASDMDLSRYDWTWRAVFRGEAWLSRIPDWIVANSQAGRDFAVSRGFCSRRIEVIANGIDTGEFRPDASSGDAARASWGIAAGAPLIGLVARLDPMKDHPTFLQAAAALLGQMPDVRFVCIGGGPAAYTHQMRELAASLGLGDAIVWAGERRDMRAVHNALDLPTLTSITEGFPNAVGEAMACGHACVVTDVGDAAAVVAATGTVVRRRDPAGLAAAWAKMLSLPAAERAALGARARQRVEAMFSVEAMVARTAAGYARVVGGQA